jgi:quercetin dioxygenase-like cupin family protein
MTLKFIKEKNGFKSYQADGFRIYYGERGSVVGDNNINPAETIYLIKGRMKVTIENRIVTYSAPDEFKVPAKTYHKLLSLTKTSFLVFVR